jgi:hypothetical protein
MVSTFQNGTLVKFLFRTGLKGDGCEENLSYFFEFLERNKKFEIKFLPKKNKS